MYRLLGPEAFASNLHSVLAPWLLVAHDPGEDDWWQAYVRLLGAVNPALPAAPSSGVTFVDNPSIEDALIRAFYAPSVLDDMPWYRDSEYFDNTPRDRDVVEQDIAYVWSRLEFFGHFEAGFWEAFQFLVTYLMFPSTRFALGGTDSAAIGSIFVSRPRQYANRDLYELLVHEFTHTAMFVDELGAPHYANERLLARQENFAVGAISGLRRPLDKVLHSLAVASEIFLHREACIGHPKGPSVHPLTPDLIAGALRCAQSLLDHEHRDSVLGERGLEITLACQDIMLRARGG
ncbi:aKG-HExxH-type peptide beta-hydroxylase [Halomonas sp. V046]|uniref:aKG-HExxH-type peptide beta-hydroxylase n=1 Tax=Halomonas sp. V046 TaxID=3459611 RepID=UPI004043A6B6